MHRLLLPRVESLYYRAKLCVGQREQMLTIPLLALLPMDEAARKIHCLSAYIVHPVRVISVVASISCE
jgi:hypothetical protein